MQTLAHHDGNSRTKPAEVATMVQCTVDALGRLDILVNNAGIQHVAAIEEFPTEKWDAILAMTTTRPPRRHHAVVALTRIRINPVKMI